MSELAQQFRDRECPGIAAFLDMLDEFNGEDDELQTELFQFVLTKIAGVRPTTIEDPVTFFRTLFRVQQRKSPFMDDGIKLLDMACRDAALMWKATEHE